MTSTDKILARVAKLLRVQESRGATEAEAQSAAEMVQRLLQEHNLTLAQVESQTSSTDGSPRVKETTDRGAFGPHHIAIMAALASNNFCLHRVVEFFKPQNHKNAKSRFIGGEWVTGWETKRHLLVGRALNVQVTVATYDYLIETIDRCAAAAGLSKRSRDRNYYLDGAAQRLVERLAERRRASEIDDTTQQPTGNGTHRELVLSDVYGSEEDLNNDALNGFPAGTTAKRRHAVETRRASQQAEHDRLVADGVDSTVAWYRAYGYSDEGAQSLANSWIKRSRRSGGRGRSQGWTQSDERHSQKINSVAYRAGRVAGGTIGLDDQVSATRRQALPRREG